MWRSDKEKLLGELVPHGGANTRRGALKQTACPQRYEPHCSVVLPSFGIVQASRWFLVAGGASAQKSQQSRSPPPGLSPDLKKERAILIAAGRAAEPVNTLSSSLCKWRRTTRPPRDSTVAAFRHPRRPGGPHRQLAQTG
ncbi:hypothetical protein GEV33_010140 [Tenebrio molitor]|uniref:Uncharacterized protein n=1 Tax=Tenebrio molitor TaxID=7067 RepID=A0A8J6HEE4_TENMO|nr:hypothetical protein GEV33_010140 [Tenebrio molitor]